MSKKLKETQFLNEDDDDDDDDDDDYVPGVESDSGEDEPDLAEGKKATKRKNKNESDDELDSDEEIAAKSDVKIKKVDEETKNTPEEKKKADEIWSNFLKDVKPAAKPTASSSSASLNKLEPEKSTKPVENTASKEAKLDELFKSTETKSDYGSKYQVKNENSNSAQDNTTPLVKKPSEAKGLAGILGKINSKNKINTLEKSKLDWEQFKKNENIEEDLNKHSKGKESYLEKRAFLDRADLRQFEIEKELRNKERKLRDAK